MEAPAGDTCLNEVAAGSPVAFLRSRTSCQPLKASRKLMYPGLPESTWSEAHFHLPYRSLMVSDLGYIRILTVILSWKSSSVLCDIPIFLFILVYDPGFIFSCLNVNKTNKERNFIILVQALPEEIRKLINIAWDLYQLWLSSKLGSGFPSHL